MSKKRPLILITNDDGITSKGIRSLCEMVMDLGDVVVVAPDKPQSGMGHAVTIDNIIRIREEEFSIAGIKAYSCSGTPVDCVKMAIYQILGKKPDLLVSGINHGSNASINVIYSGTMSAAVEGAVEGIPSIGFSLLDHDQDADFSASIKFGKQIAEKVLENGTPEGVCLNVNIPKSKTKEIQGIKICRQAMAHWEDNFDKRTSPLGGEYYWMTGEFVNPDKGEDTDQWALKHNYISIVPTQFDLTAHHSIGTLNTWEFE